jgi:hypothetical protein
MTGIPRSGLPRLLQQNCQIGHPETGLGDPVFSRFWPLNPRITCMALGNLHNARGSTAPETTHLSLCRYLQDTHQVLSDLRQMLTTEAAA